MKPVFYALTLVLCLGFSSALQAANRYWIATSTANWNNTANWSTTPTGAGGASVPGSSEIANFTSSRVGNCIINATVSLTSLVISSGYTGTITQGANPVTISGAATFGAGTFIGGSTMTVSGAVSLSGTNFTFPATLNMNGSAWAYTAGTLDPMTNNSTVVFGTTIVITGSHTLNNITFNNTTPYTMTFTLTGATLTANGNMNTNGSSPEVFTGGTINLLGNITLGNTGTGGGGTTVLAFAGTGAQTITSALSLNQSSLPSVNINKPSGTLTFPSMLSMGGSSWIYTTGTLDVTTNNSTVVFNTNTTFTGSHTLNNINFNNATPYTQVLNFATGTTVTAGGSTAISGISTLLFNGGTVSLLGDLNLTNTGTNGRGSTVFAFAGTASQAITSALTINQSSIPSVNINKASGTLTFPSLLNMGGSTWVYTTGTLDVTTNNSTVVFDGNTTFTGSHSLNNVNFNNPSPYTQVLNFSTGTTVTTSGNMTISGISTLQFNGGTIGLLGNLNLTNTGTNGGGSTVIAFTASVNQSIISSLTIDQSSIPSVNINKPSGTLIFPSLLTMAGSTWTYTTGTLDVTTNNSTVVFGGNTTFTGSHTLNNIDFDNATPYSQVLAFSTGTTVTASGNMTISGISTLDFNGGTINLLGNLILTNTGTNGGGSTVIAFVAAVNQAIISSLTIYQGSIPSVNINKPSSTLTFPSLLTMVGDSWAYTTGILDVTTNNSTVVFGSGSTLFTGSHTLNNIDFDNSSPYSNFYTFNTGTVLTASGNMAMSGISSLSFSGGTIDVLGNLNLTNTSVNDGGSTAITFVSAGAQAINSTLPVNESSLPSININKAGGTLTFPSILTMAGTNWTWTAGTVDAISSASTVFFTGTTNIKSAGMNFYNITISGTGVLTPGANTISLLGNWTDRSTAGFTEGTTSTVNFNGSSLQTITSPGGENFAGLTVNNSGAGIQLLTNVTVAKTLTMTQGNIDLNSNTLTLGTGAAAANTGTLAYTAGTIINAGAFTRWFKTGVIATGAAAGLFPVGTVTDYMPFSVSAPITGPTTGGTMTLVYTDPGFNTGVFFPDGTFWVGERKNLNWALSTAGVAGGNYNLGVAGTAFQTVANVNDLRLTLANSVVGTAGTNGGTTSNPQINRTALNLANLTNTFFVGSVNPAMTTLPVSLISFTATASGGETVLDWSTAQETNSDHFTIQRSADGVSWDNLQQVAAAGTSNSALDYTAYDLSPLSGNSLYRLMMTDKDGGVTYSAIRSVFFGSRIAGIAVYPNPAVNYLGISFAHAGNYEVTLLNDLGQVLAGGVSPNGDKLSLNVSAFRPGVYFVRIDANGSSETRTVVIRR
jgi:hypothetical protein